MRTLFSRSAVFVLAVLLGSAMPAAAHHSDAMYDMTKDVTLHGTVQKFEWTNPHIHLWFFVDGDKPGAQPVLWVLEAGSPGSQTRRGWDKRILNPGDKATLDVHPLRDGRHAGLLTQILGPDGKPLAHRSRPETEKPGLE
jgi:hypothetical protein